MTIEELTKRAMHRPGIDLYSVEDAILLVRLCQQASIQILGIDAFKIYGDKIQPIMENSVDLSEDDDSYNSAIKFLTDRYNLSFMYEIVY